MIITWVAYLIIALSGYFSTFDQTNSIVLNRKPLHKEIDYFLLFGKIAISITLTFACPLNFNPLRQSILNIIFPSNSELTYTRVILIGTIIWVL